MEQFTPLSAMIGGAIIGISSALFLTFNGRIAGVSGVASGIFSRKTPNVVWRSLFLIGLIGGVGAYRLAGGSLQEINIISSLPVLIGAGLLTGIGTDMGRGCTSGHGICGIARLSMRSIAATGTFVFIAAATFFFTRHIVGG